MMNRKPINVDKSAAERCGREIGLKLREGNVEAARDLLRSFEASLRQPGRDPLDESISDLLGQGRAPTAIDRMGKAGIKTVRDLLEYREADLVVIDYVGAQVIDWIKEETNKRGITWPQTRKAKP